MKLPHPHHKNCHAATRTRGRAASRCLLPPHATAAPAPSPASRRGSSFSSPPHCSCRAELRRSATWLMINTNRCGVKSSPSGGAVVPVRGHARRRHPGPGGPPCSGVAKGAALGSGVRGGGRGADLAVRLPPPSCRAEYASVTAGWTPGVTDQDLRWLEAWLGHRRCLAGVMAGLSLPARHRRPIVAVAAWGSILLGHDVVLGGAYYADRLKGWMNLAPRISWDVGCGEGVGPEIAQELLYLEEPIG
jgi:hypothetical protein